MSLTCNIEFIYDSSDKAKVVLESISPDNFQYIDARAEENRLIVCSTSESPMQMLHTMEDLLACMKIAEETFDMTH